MPTLDLVNQKNQKVGSIELNNEIFAGEVNVPLIHQVIKAQLADRRQGTAKTKCKGEVRGGGKKPFRQKGTGNARQGSSRSPLQPGGGQNFGPIPRSYAQKTPKEMVRGALKAAIADRAKAGRLIVIDEIKFDKIKTKQASDMIVSTFKLDKALFIDRENKNFELSARNLPRVRVLRTEGINVYDIIRHNWLVMTKEAVQAIETRLTAK